MDKKRFVTDKIDRLLKMFPAVALIGPRQCGKTTLVKHLLPDWKYYDLERPDDYRLITDDPLGFFSRRPGQVIIDEAQEYPELFNVLRGVIDRDRSAAGRFVLTGSSSPEMVKGISESLAGRIATVELWPLKGAEFHDKPLPLIYGFLVDRNLALDHLLCLEPVLTPGDMYRHWFLGGFPEPRIKGSQMPEFHGLWMDAFFADYVNRDISRLFPRINRHTYRLFIQSLSHHSGHILNQSEIARALEVSSPTVKQYMEIIHDTFIWRNLRSYEKNSLKKVQKMPKGFFRDPGMLHYLLKIFDVDTLLLHPAAGGSFEAFVIEEMIRGFQCTLTPGMDYYFYRTVDKSEVDLVIDGPFGLIPVEVKLGHKITKRMLTGLNNFLNDTGAKFGILVNNAERVEMLTDHIIQVPAIYL